MNARARTRRRVRSTFALAALLASALAAPAVADHPAGPPIGNNRFKSVIEAGPQGTDVDDYTAVLAVGDRLTFSVRSPFQSPLLPEVRLIDPDGRDRTAEAAVRERTGGKRVVVKGFPIDRTGTWAVRIAGRIETEGAYVVSFRVAAPPRADLRDQQIGDGEERTFAVEAAAGSSLDVDLSWGRGAPVELVDVRDPAGQVVVDDEGRGAADLVRAKKKGAKLRKLPLTGGDGAYAVRVRAARGATSFRIRTRVRPPRRPTGQRKLDGVEPHVIRPLIDPIPGVEGQRVRIDAWNLSVGAAPRVLFGAAAGRDVIVDPSGGYLFVTVPAGEDGAIVPVTVINPDDQASVADALFEYVPPPVITALEGADGAPAVGGSAEGGDLVRIEGENLRTGQLVSFGNGPEIIPVLRDGGLEVTTRPQAPGRVRVFVRDSFEHEAASPGEYEFKAAPTFAGSPYSPPVAGTDGDTAVLVRGTGFEATDVLTFDGEAVPFEIQGSTFLRFTPPARQDGLYGVRIVDRFGLTATAPDLRIKAPGIVDAVTPVAGAYLGSDEISLHGGTTLDVTGSRFAPSDAVIVAGTAATIDTIGSTRITCVAPASSAGVADVVVEDALGQQTTVSSALRLVGYRDLSATRAPSRTTVDDRSALRGAAADLDGDGDVDDVVLVSHDATGTRAERTRLLVGGSGALSDATATRLPRAGSDASGVDDLRAAAVAIGDLDGTDGPDILIAGTHPDSTGYGEVRWLVNDGYGSFSLDEYAVPGSTYAARVTAQDENGVEHEVLSARTVRGRPTALAIGDLDGDGDLDVVVGRDSFESRRFGVDASVVDFGQSPAYVTAADAAAYLIDEVRYHPGVRVLENRIAAGSGLVDVTATNVPSAGDDGDVTPLPALHARDLALADLDGDDDLDLVVTWDDPTTVTAYGLAQGSGTDTPRLATRVLLNDGDGAFTDATGSWMPQGSSPEWYQATRVALADLDGDGDPDVVLAHEEGVDLYQGPATYTRLALRVLRNDHDPATGQGGLTDVSAAVLPGLGSASNDNLRARALRIADVDGDGALDILIAVTSPPRATGGGDVAALRLLSGAPGGLLFKENTGFLPPIGTDSGQADDLLLVPDLSPETQPALLLLSETVPAASTGSRLLRAFDWQR